MADLSIPTTAHSSAPQLRRALGRFDLVLLFVVAIFNLNVVPSIAANGGVTVWLWIIAVLLFFLPEGVAVIELAHRYPGEGGVYLWAKEVFGDFHGFLSGWCYWTNNMMYVPTVMLYFVGVSVFVMGPSHAALGNDKLFAVIVSLALLAVLVWLNIVGLGVGKWINNVGSIGTGIATVTLIVLGVVVWSHFGTSLSGSDFRMPANMHSVMNSFGVICFALVGLELASVMGDEIKDPAKTLPGAVAWGGLISGVFYIAATLILLLAVSKKNINVLEGIVQAVSHLGARIGMAWIIAPFALVLSVSIAGIGSAWLAGTARVPFVAGIDSYLPRWMGKIHPRYGTPHAALIVNGVVSTVLVLIGFLGAGVQESFQKLLSLAVVLQLVPFLYIFAALLKIGLGPTAGKGHYGKGVLLLAGGSGLLITILGMVFVFFPAKQITSLASYEAWMAGGTAAFIGAAVFFFYFYGRNKVLPLKKTSA